MVKISIKKEKNVRKQKQKQKQKQSQKVIVNVGSNTLKRKRASTKSTIQKKQQQTTTPTINVPQALPVNKQDEALNKLLIYLKERDAQKITQPESKNNDLEKDKKEEEKTPTAPEERRDIIFQATQNRLPVMSDSQSVSSLTSGTATPLSRPLDTRSLIDRLVQIADDQGENPLTGSVSLSTFSTSSSSQSLRPFSSNDSVDSFSNISSSSSRSSSSLSHNSINQPLNDYLNDRQPEPPIFQPDEEAPIIQPEPQIIEPVIEPEPQLVIEPEPQPVIEPQIIQPIIEQEQVIEPEPQPLLMIEPEPTALIINEPQKAQTTATATQLLLGMDNSSIPPTIKPFREALPQINKEYIQNLPGLRISDEETKKQREARVKKFDTPKIEQEKPQTKAPPPKAEEIISPEDETPNTPKDPRLVEIERLTITQMGELLMKNNVKGPNNQPYTKSLDGKRVLLSGKNQLKQPLSERFKQAYNDGLISNFSYTSKTK
jgi:hypothetical protein